MKRIKVTIRTNKVGSECTDYMEFEDEDWNSMTDEERDAQCHEFAMNYAEWSYEEVPSVEPRQSKSANASE